MNELNIIPMLEELENLKNKKEQSTLVELELPVDDNFIQEQQVEKKEEKSWEERHTFQL